MVKLKVHPNELPEEIYSQKKSFYFKTTIFAIFLACIAFMLNFPIGKIIKSQVENTLRSNPSCPISYDELKFEWFMPKVILTKPVINGKCYNNPSSSLKLSDLTINMQSPSFWPIGVKLHTKIKHKLSVLNIYPTIGITGQVIKIEKSSISHKTIKELLGPKSFSFTGDFELESLIELSKGNISNADVLITSTNLSILAQNISGLDLPNLPIQSLQIKGSVNAKNILEIQDFQLGGRNSPILTEAAGTIKLNPHNMPNSILDLDGEIKFSASFLESFGIINMMLSGKQSTPKGFYKFKIGGNLSSPNPSFN